MLTISVLIIRCYSVSNIIIVVDVVVIVVVVSIITIGALVIRYEFLT